MSDRKTLQIEKSRAIPAPPGLGNAARLRSLQTGRYHHLHRLQGLAKWRASSGTTCRSAATHFSNKHLPDHAADALELSRESDQFNEHQREDGTIQWVDEKRSVHALRRSGMPGSVSSRWCNCEVHQRHCGF